MTKQVQVHGPIMYTDNTDGAACFGCDIDMENDSVDVEYGAYAWKITDERWSDIEWACSHAHAIVRMLDIEENHRLEDEDIARWAAM